MNYTIRFESSADYEGITEVTAKAFGCPNEAELICDLRRTPEFVPQLSIVALHENNVVGHILFYPVKVAGYKIYETFSRAHIKNGTMYMANFIQ